MFKLRYFTVRQQSLSESSTSKGYREKFRNSLTYFLLIYFNLRQMDFHWNLYGMIPSTFGLLSKSMVRWQFPMWAWISISFRFQLSLHIFLLVCLLKPLYHSNEDNNLWQMSPVRLYVLRHSQDFQVFAYLVKWYRTLSVVNKLLNILNRVKSPEIW